MYTPYTDMLSAESLLMMIANEPVELSHEKVRIQRDEFQKAAKSWIAANIKSPSYENIPFNDDFNTRRPWSEWV